MKISKKGYVFFILIVLLYVFKGFIYRVLIKYDVVEERKAYSVIEPKLINYIEETTINNDLPNLVTVLKKSSKLTNKKLRFTSSKCDVDPNLLVNSSKTHCVGYAHFYTSICNYLLKQSNLTKWKAKPYAAKLYFLGIDIHTYFDSPFFKDHDVVIIENSETEEKIYVDPTISDYLGIHKVSKKGN